MKGARETGEKDEGKTCARSLFFIWHHRVCLVFCISTPLFSMSFAASALCFFEIGGANRRDESIARER